MKRACQKQLRHFLYFPKEITQFIQRSLAKEEGPIMLYTLKFQQLIPAGWGVNTGSVVCVCAHEVSCTYGVRIPCGVYSM